MMAFVFPGDGRVERLERPLPVPRVGEVRVKLARAAVCGTDLHKRRRPAIRQPRNALGDLLVSGHEPVGWIESVGPDVNGVEVGARVLVAGVVGCGRCGTCAAGYNTACEAGAGGLHGTWDGSNATHMVIPARNAIPLPNELSFDAAVVLTCAGGTAMTVVEECGLATDEGVAQTVGIVGLGPVGLCLLLLARSFGHRTLGVDLNPRRLEHALGLGLDRAVDARHEDPVAVAKTLGRGGCDVVAECAGGGKARATALRLARRRGKVALAGLGEDPDVESLAALAIAGDLTLRGIAATPIGLFPGLVKRACQLPFEKIVTHRFPLAELPSALDLMAGGDCGKIVIDVADRP